MAVLLPLLLLTSVYHMVKSGNPPLENGTKSHHYVLCERGCICVEGQTIFLDCIKKNFTKLPLTITFAPETKVVTFEENFLQNVAKSTFVDGSSITDLDLSHNQLTQIEDYTFRSFSSLTVLRLSSNKFSSLSSKLLYGLTNLVTLELGHNELEQFPKGFFFQTLALQELKLQFNRFQSLPNTTFQFLNHLEKLDLAGNKLMALTDDLFRHTPRLHSLSLAGNEFKRVPRTALLKPTYLHSLDLSYNKFEILPSGSFSSLRNLSFLHLNDLIRLTRVERNAFSNMPRLKILSCSYNPRLAYFDPEAFGGNSVDAAYLYPKEQLILRRNGLMSLPEPQKIETWAKLNHIDLSENPWKCDCRIRWMRKLKSILGDNVRCESPFSMHGREIISLSEEEMVCEDHWMFSTIILMTTSVIAITVCVMMLTLILCTHPSCRRLRVRTQFSYRKFVPKKEDTVDLDWDPTSIM